MEFIKEVLTDLIKRGIFDLDSEDFNLWCIRNDFITANIKQEIYDFKKSEEGQRFIIHLQGAREMEKLKIGDKVRMNDKYRVSEKNKDRVFIVRSEPTMICGTECVFLEDYRGCYAADGLTKVD